MARPTQQQITQLDQDVSSYQRVRSAIISKVNQTESDAQNNRIPLWLAAESITDLYQELHATPERRQFLTHVARAKTDADYEKYLRAAHSKHFLKVKLDPTKL